MCACVCVQRARDREEKERERARERKRECERVCLFMDYGLGTRAMLVKYLQRV